MGKWPNLAELVTARAGAAPVGQDTGLTDIQREVDRGNDPMGERHDDRAASLSMPKMTTVTAEIESR